MLFSKGANLVVTQNVIYKKRELYVFKTSQNVYRIQNLKEEYLASRKMTINQLASY